MKSGDIEISHRLNTGEMYRILVRFISGQTLVQMVNVVIGIALLWLLPVNEYAFYVLSMLFLTVASMITNMGISRAITTLGSRHQDDRLYLGLLYSTGLLLSKRFFIAVAVGTLLISLNVFHGREWSVISVTLAMSLVIPASWLQNRIVLQQALLNIQHDDRGLFTASFAGSIFRLMLTGLCLIWPVGALALLGNLGGVMVTSIMLARRTIKYAHTDVLASKEIRETIIRFIVPLSPMIIYFAFQSQISTLILGFYGYTESIAQVGALGRLGQIIALLMMLNPFFIQPYFARIKDRDQFVFRLILVMILLVVLFILLMLSATMFPSVWLIILGNNYSGLMQELPVAVSAALLTLIGGTLYTIALSREETRSQYWGVIFGFASQVGFIAIYGISTTLDALYLNMLPAASYALIQALIVIRIVLYDWKTA